MRRGVAGVALVVVLGAAAGCGGGGSDQSAPPTTRGSSSTTTTARPAAQLSGFKECAGTGVLTKAAISGNGDTVGITWTLARPITAENPGYYALVGTYQIGLRDLPGNEVAMFVADLAKGGQVNLKSSYLIDGTTAQLIVPSSALKGVTMDDSFTVTVTGGGSDLDTCTV